jgi:ATP-dependent RNA helicase RhlE
MTFASLGLSEPILLAVGEQGYSTPTPIQAQAIPAVLAGGDLLAAAQTGTGKTAAFTLPLLHRLNEAQPARNARGQVIPRVLVLVPTRELAAQVAENVRDYGKHLKLRSMVMYGGVGMQPQIDALRRGVDIVVATPGRMLDHHGQRTLDLSAIDTLVLDEADRMLDMGFIHDIRKVLSLLPRKRQNLLFSATFSDEIKALANTLLNQPKVIEVARRNVAAATVRQTVHPVGRDRKRELLAHLIRERNWWQVLVFMRTKHGANRLAEQLRGDGIGADAIHGNKSQGARTRALAEFKSGKLQVLVATDIAARGIDIDQLPMVVNYELPNVPEDYVHRIGRTGRAGAEGEAISLVCVDELRFLRDIENLTGRGIERSLVAGFEPDPQERAQPIRVGRTVIGGGRAGSGPRRADASRGQGGHGRGDSGGGHHGHPGQGRRNDAQPRRDGGRGSSRGAAPARRNGTTG